MKVYLWLGAFAIVVAAITGAFMKGYQSGEKNVLVDIMKSRAESAEEKQEIDNEVKELDRDELLDRALDFVR